jgi:hypothetical protein
MKSIKALFTALLAASTFYSQAQQTETPLQDFNKVELRGSVKVKLKVADRNAIGFEDGNPANTVSWEIEGSTLEIDGAGNTATLYVKNISAVEVSGTSSIKSEDTLRGDNLIMEISGSGSMELILVATNLKADISGVGKMELKGKAQSLKADISGSGKLFASKLETQNTTIDISGTGIATVNATENLDASITGTGKVYYKGSPKNVTQNITGLGQLGPLTDTIELELGKITPSKPQKTGGNWAGFELGFNGLVTDDGKNIDDLDGNLELITEKSIAVHFNFYEKDFKLYKHYVLASTGVGLSYNNYRFRKNIDLKSDNPVFDYTVNDSLNYRKNKLTVSYVTVPVLLTINTSENPKKAFHLTTGMIFAYRLGSHTKKVYNENGDKKKDKNYDDFNIEPFRYDATLRLGYRQFTVFANYALTDLFKNNQGLASAIHPWTMGVSLTAF